MAIRTEDLAAAVARARAAAANAGELTPPRPGPIRSRLPEALRDAVAEDLRSGVYERVARQAVAGDPDLVDT